MNLRFMPFRAAAGLQAGMAGGLVMLGWLSLTTLWSRNSIWWFPNLMATTFGGDPALQPSFGKYSLSGLALHFIQYSLLGVVYAKLVPERAPYTRLLSTGLIIAVAYYYLMYGFVWKHLNPLVPLYSPDRQILAGHLFYGFMLTRIRNYRSASVAVDE